MSGQDKYLKEVVRHHVWNERKIALMLSHDTGRKIADFFSNRKNEKIVAVYFEDQNDYSADICEKLEVSQDQVYYGKQILSNPKHISWLKEQEIDFVITVYWPWILIVNTYLL